MADLNAILAPGMLVTHPDHPEWGTGQVQSVVGQRITVNFPEAGKVVFDGTRIPLTLVSLGPAIH
ncbi:DUF3553 domain-containing protein [Rubellimicrobium rubrum]|uniref:DUF3553 domain-containing protein n=1 Tax=Rubellimicrobium rubrum TaxID=2585369 RepID=A0A5C4N4L9_9RHOB|nr:DUF3553 domain-containing protein [Rubellimicrobium rubrum]TNC51214.1 DUF3553 domain-containing protein [Rubellimicrobium rubrum]